MERHVPRLVLAAALLVAGLPGGAGAAHTGLWVGAATLDRVSEVNKPVGDLSFDLQLTGVHATESLVAFGDSWRYHDGGLDLGTAWRNVVYDDRTWSAGAGPLGYDEAIATPVTGGQITTYFRRTFTLANTSQYREVRITLLRDDGAVVYLNGQEVFRSNLPEGPLAPDTPAAAALACRADSDYKTKVLAPSVLAVGTNVVAVELHQAFAADDDAAFALELVARSEDPVTRAQTDEVLVPLSAAWRHDGGAGHTGTDWRQASYDDAAWLGPSPAPFGRDPFVFGTEVSYGGDAASKHVTTYFRKGFRVLSAAIYSGLRMRLRRDDGVVVYLNGSEVFRNNLPATLTTAATLASAYVDGPSRCAALEVSLPPGALRSGDNVVAVELHQASRTDRDLVFDLELAGDVLAPPTTELVGLESLWRFNNSGSADPAWADPAFTPGSAWSDPKPGHFGYGDGDEATRTDAGVPAPPVTTYFLKEFAVPDPAQYSHLVLILFRDDGAVVYLNGAEVLRSNMPEGPVDAATPPVKVIGSDQERVLVDAMVPGTRLVAGRNVIAVEVHQHPDELALGQSRTRPPTPTPATLTVPVILHEDEGGTVRLLKEVTQLFDETSRQLVLVTDETRIPDFGGVVYRSGDPIGRRVSTVGYDFPGREVVCDGSLDGTLTCAITLPGSHPTNPFLHRYHPDHDNLDPRYEKPAAESPAVSRTLTLTFSSSYPPDGGPSQDPPPGWGLTLVGGTWGETLTGLYRDPVQVGGSFTLQRVSERGLLNE